MVEFYAKKLIVFGGKRLVALIKKCIEMTTARGKSPLTVTDVSLIEHTVNVTLESESITDFSNVVIKTAGKNLFDPSAWVGGEITELNGVPCLFVQEYDYVYFLVSGSPDTKYTFKGTVYRGEGHENKISNLKALKSDGTVVSLKSNLLRPSTENTFNCTVYGGDKLHFIGHGVAGVYIDLTVTQLELGEEATAFEPFKGICEYTANTDGTVDGVKSISPTMTVITEQSDIDITLEYQKEI